MYPPAALQLQAVLQHFTNPSLRLSHLICAFHFYFGVKYRINFFSACVVFWCVLWVSLDIDLHKRLKMNYLYGYGYGSEEQSEHPSDMILHQSTAPPPYEPGLGYHFSIPGMFCGFCSSFRV